MSEDNDIIFRQVGRSEGPAAHPAAPSLNAQMMAREIIAYVMENDILTQHGMAGLRTRLAQAIDKPEPIYRAMLRRAHELMDAAAGTPEGAELDALADAIVAYEAKMIAAPATAMVPHDEKGTP